MYLAYSQDCTTEWGPSSNMKCVFPFIFGKTTYNKCKYDSEYGYWCSTKVDSSGIHIGSQGNWGTCNANCPKEGKKKISSHFWK